MWTFGHLVLGLTRSTTRTHKPTTTPIQHQLHCYNCARQSNDSTTARRIISYIPLSWAFPTTASHHPLLLHTAFDSSLSCDSYHHIASHPQKNSPHSSTLHLMILMLHSHGLVISSFNVSYCPLFLAASHVTSIPNLRLPPPTSRNSLSNPNRHFQISCTPFCLLTAYWVSTLRFARDIWTDFDSRWVRTQLVV